MRKLKPAEIKPYRERQVRQTLTCALCKRPLSQDKAVLDHDHQSGAIRGALHRGCNSLLGKLENNHRRYGVDLEAFIAGVGAYLKLHSTNQTNLLHPTFRTPEERKALQAKRRKKAKAVTKKLLTNLSKATT